jgi:hypothetical protein
MDDLNKQNDDLPERPLSELPKVPELKQTEDELKTLGERARAAGQAANEIRLPEVPRHTDIPGKADAPNMPPPQSGYASPGAYGNPLNPETNAWAIIALVCGIMSFIALWGIGGIAAIIAGVYARNQITASRGTQTGDGLAVAGIVLGAINLLVICVAALCFGLPIMLGIVAAIAGG